MNFVVIKHFEHGNDQNGKTIYEEFNNKIKDVNGKVVLIHDASKMVSADIYYATHFKNAEKLLSNRLVAVMCSVSATVPRMMAHTVSMVSSTKWHVFKSNAEMIGHLSSQEVKISESDLDIPSGSHVKVISL